MRRFRFLYFSKIWISAITKVNHMRVIVILVAVLVTGCRGHDDSGFQRQRLLTDVKAQKMAKLSDYTDFSWDKFYVFEPYASEREIQKEVGHAVAFHNADSEGFCLLVFVDKGKLQRSFEEPRYPIDFCGISRRGGYTRDQALFTSVRTGDRFDLKPANKEP
jgi:hypothetical protein